MCPEQRRRHTVAAALWAFAAGLVGLYLILFGLVAASRIARPLDEFTYGESWLLDGARRIAQGGPRSSPADQVPIMHSAYTPLYYLLVGEVERVVGDHGYTVGRLI